MEKKESEGLTNSQLKPANTGSFFSSQPVYHSLNDTENVHQSTGGNAHLVFLQIAWV